MPRRGYLTRDPKRDAALEALIDTAGRDAVFAKVREWGWAGDDAPPKSVWEDAARDVMSAPTGEQG